MRLSDGALNLVIPSIQSFQLILFACVNPIVSHPVASYLSWALIPFSLPHRSIYAPPTASCRPARSPRPRGCSISRTCSTTSASWRRTRSRIRRCSMRCVFACDSFCLCMRLGVGACVNADSICTLDLSSIALVLAQCPMHLPIASAKFHPHSCVYPPAFCAHRCS